MGWFSKDEPKVAKPKDETPQVQKAPAYAGFAFNKAANALRSRTSRIDQAVDDAVMGKKPR